MKQFWKIGLAAVGCCAIIGLAVSIAVQHEASDESTMPDLSILGLDTDDFTYSGVYYREIAIGYEWNDDTTEKPCYEWSKYERDDGAYLVLDEYNRLTIFSNAYEIKNATVSPDDVLSTDALIAKASEITNDLVINGDEFSYFDDLSVINDTKTEVVFRRTISDYSFDYSDIRFSQDGTVKYLTFEYSDVPTDFTPTALDTIAENDFEKTVAPRYSRNYHDVEYDIKHPYFFNIGGTIYGAYTAVITFYSDEQLPLSDAVGVVVNYQ